MNPNNFSFVRVALAGVFHLLIAAIFVTVVRTADANAQTSKPAGNCHSLQNQQVIVSGVVDDMDFDIVIIHSFRDAKTGCAIYLDVPYQSDFSCLEGRTITVTGTLKYDSHQKAYEVTPAKGIKPRCK